LGYINDLRLAGVERKKREKAIGRKNAGGSEIETLDDSQDDDILESVIKSVTTPTPSSRPTRDRRRARTGTRTSCNYYCSFLLCVLHRSCIVWLCL